MADNRITLTKPSSIGEMVLALNVESILVMADATILCMEMPEMREAVRLKMVRTHPEMDDLYQYLKMFLEAPGIPKEVK